ncbi:hypothetical protein QFZ76_009555 [Streptomyces sp. V4I2]|nr:hypothetical protein [Streptomyces sp. V4I2]
MTRCSTCPGCCTSTVVTAVQGRTGEVGRASRETWVPGSGPRRYSPVPPAARSGSGGKCDGGRTAHWAQPGVGWPPLNGTEDAPGEQVRAFVLGCRVRPGSVHERGADQVDHVGVREAVRFGRHERHLHRAEWSGAQSGTEVGAPARRTLSGTRLRLRASRQRSGLSASVPPLGVMIRGMELSSGVFAPKEMDWDVPPPRGRVLCAGAPPEASVSGRPSQPTARRAAISCVSWGATEKRSPTTP